MPRTTRTPKTRAPISTPQVGEAPQADETQQVPQAPAGTAGGCGHGADRCAQCAPVHPAGPYTVNTRAAGHADTDAGRPGQSGRS